MYSISLRLLGKIPNKTVAYNVMPNQLVPIWKKGELFVLSSSPPPPFSLPQSQIQWTSEVETCLSSHSAVSCLKVHRQNYVATLASTAALLKTLPRTKRAVIAALLTLDLHNRDVFSTLLANKIASNTDFEWTK